MKKLKIKFDDSMSSKQAYDLIKEKIDKINESKKDKQKAEEVYNADY